MLNVVNSLAIVNVVFLFVLLILRKNNSTPNKVLAFLFLVPGLYFVSNLLIINNWIDSFPIVFFVVQILAIAFPVLTIKYVYLLVFDTKKKIESYLLFGSFVLLIVAILMTLQFFLLENEAQQDYLKGLKSGNYPNLPALYTISFYFWLVVYYIHALVSIIRYKVRVYNNLSNEDLSLLAYVRQFILIFGVLTSLLVALYISLPIPVVDYFFLPVFVSVCYFFVLFKLIQHNALFTQARFERIQLFNETIEKNSKKPNEKNDTKLVELIGRLEQVIEKEALYLDPNLTLDMLSAKLNSPAYVVSKCINSHYGKSFFDLINEQRVQYAKSLILQNDETETFESIGLKSGFNSRASFYRSFKKYTGVAPGDFVSKH